MSDREFIARVEAANTEEFINILRRPSKNEERLLSLHLGRERYERLRQLALRRSRTRKATPRGNVVVLHGIMGGELTVFDKGKPQHIWMNFLRLVIGGAGWLRMRDRGTSLFDVRATGILKKWYSEMLLSLAQEWNVQAFWYDWRRDLADSADALNARIQEWFGNEPFHLVGHSMGGLVARTFIRKYGERWKKAWDKGDGAAGGRLVMLGTPNHGSFSIPQICTGCEESVRKLVIADVKHNASELVAIVNTFPGSYQMLPSTAVMPEMERLYRAETYGEFGVPQGLLDDAKRNHELLAPIVDGERMIYIAGYNRRTYVDIQNWARLSSLDAYRTSMNGDGTVPHRLGFLEANGKRIPTYFANAQHGALPNDGSVIAATEELLIHGKCSLPQSVPAGVRARPSDAIDASERARIRNEEAQIAAIAEKTRATKRGRDPDEVPPTTDEKEAERLILRSFLSGADDSEAGIAKAGRGTANGDRGAMKAEAGERAEITIKLVRGLIQDEAWYASSKPQVDAIAVGHYLGVKPQAAEEGLDRAVTEALAQKNGKQSANGSAELLLTLFTERGIIRGELGQPFILADPRDTRRVIVLAGMGTPGHFGVPELTVLAQELCWTLGRLQKRHLATVLIGAGTGNLSVEDAIHAWLRGIRRALANSGNDEPFRLKQITFAESNPNTYRLIDLALRRAVSENDPRLLIHYEAPGSAVLKKAKEEALRVAKRKLAWEFDNQAANGKPKDAVPVRISVALAHKTYQFAALTESASVPQRDIPIDPKLIEEANGELARSTFEDQMECGRFLEKLLIPEDIRGLLYTPAPIVLTLDSTTARVHWEMLAKTDSRAAQRGAGEHVEFNPDDFLGTSYGVDPTASDELRAPSRTTSSAQAHTTGTHCRRSCRGRSTSRRASGGGRGGGDI